MKERMRERRQEPPVRSSRENFAIRFVTAGLYSLLGLMRDED